MSSVSQLSRLVRVDLREAWPHEASNFTPWLAEDENLRLLGDTLGLELQLEAVEKPVDTFSADILAKDAISGNMVLIENQLEQTDHNHLGQILTYAAGLNARTVIWIAREFRDPHRAAIDYLNEISSPDHNFFGVQLELYRIENSPYAPRFNIVAKPNDWSKRLVAQSKSSPNLVAAKQDWVDYWARFFAQADALKLTLANRVPPKEGWCRVRQVRSGDPSVAAWVHHAACSRALIWLQGTMAKPIFDHLHQHKQEIEERFGASLTWDRMDGRKSSMIHAECPASRFAGEQDEFVWFADNIRALVNAIEPLAGIPASLLDGTQVE